MPSAASWVPCPDTLCAPELTGANCLTCPAIGVPVEITLTPERLAYVERLIAATTDTGAEPLTVEQYVQQMVDNRLDKHLEQQTAQSYG